MAANLKTHSRLIDDAVTRLVSRAADPRGLTASDVRPRVERAVEKYLLQSGISDSRDIASFIDEIRADEMCLVLACERGDERAWEDLVKNFDSTVRSAARKVCSNSEDAEDLASSIWAELHGLRTDADGNRKSKLAYYSGRGSLAGWLRAIVSQLAVDEYRKHSKFVQIEEAREFENLAEESSNNSSNDGLVTHPDNPEKILSDKQTSGDVADALAAGIASLEAEDRLVLKLYYFDDLKLKEIATMFGYHEATASRKIVRIQNEIRKAAEKHLRESHGWNDGEVKRYLADTAANLGISLEKLFAILIAVVFVQEMIMRGVL